MATQGEIQTWVKWGIERLSKGKDPSRTLEENPATGGREALAIIKQWEQTPEGQRFTQAGEEAVLKARELGFESTAEFLEFHPKGFTPVRKPDIPPPPSKAEPDFLERGIALGKEAPKDAIFLKREEAEAIREEQQRRQQLAEERQVRTEERFERFREFDIKPEEFVARTKTGGISTFGTISQSLLTTADIVTAQLRLDKLVEGTVLGKGIRSGTAVRVGADIGTFTFFGPAFPSTFAIEKATQPTGVVFAGTRQNIKTDLLKTETIFKTTIGERGIARAITKIKDIGGRTISETATIGGTISKAVKFPTGKEVIKTDTIFGARQIGVTREIKGIVTKDIGGIIVKKEQPLTAELTFGKIIGRIKGRKFKDVFMGRGLSITGREGTILSVGDTITKRTAGSVSLGIIKKADVGKGITSISIKGGKTVSQRAIQDIQSTVRAGITQPPKVSTRITPPTTIIKTPKTQTIQTPKTIQAPTTKLGIKEKQKISQVSLVGVKQPQGIKIAQSLKTGQVVKQKQEQRQQLREAQALKLVQKVQPKVAQRQAISLRMRSLQKQRFAMGVPITPAIPKTTPTKPIIPFLFLKGKPERKRKPVTFGVAVRRRGVFRPVAKGLSLQKAISVGRGVAARTLAATFKITPERGITTGIRTPKGFYAKPTKQGILFIEKRKHRLSMATEVRGIQLAKTIKMKGGLI